jgi:hypothetical protein
MDQELKETLSRIAEALDRLAPTMPPSADAGAAEADVWHASGRRLEAVPKVNRVALARDVQPPPPDAARHDRKRAIDSHKPF